MTYTAEQIERAKKQFNAYMKIRAVESYSTDAIGKSGAENQCDFHNKQVSSILAGDKDLEKEWKLFFLNEEVKADKKASESKAKLVANKEASTDVLAPIKAAKKIGEFGKWLNNARNPFRKEHFSKKYTQEAVNAFLSL